MGRNRKAFYHTTDAVFDQVFEEYYARSAKADWREQVQRHYRNHIKPVFGDKKVSELTRHDVVKWHNYYADNVSLGNRLLSILSTLLKYANLWMYIPSGRNVAEGVPFFPEICRERYATQKELKTLIECLERRKAQGTRYTHAVCFIYFLIYTGARPSAVANARYKDLQIQEDGVGVIKMEGKSTGKTGKKETVIVPPHIVKMVQDLPRVKVQVTRKFQKVRTMDNESLIGIRLPSSFWRSLMAETGIKELWMRDLRRTFATMGMANGVAMDQISEVLNHQSTQTTKIYAKLPPKQKIETALMISDKISEAIYGKGTPLAASSPTSP